MAQADTAGGDDRLAAVEIRPEALTAPQTTDDQAAPVAEAPLELPTAPTSIAAAAFTRPGLIEVELPTGVRLRVGADVYGAALRRVLAALGPP